MEAIRGTTRPRRRRWWVPRPRLRLVRDQWVPQTGDDRFIVTMIGSLGLLVLAVAMFMGAWTGG